MMTSLLQYLQVTSIVFSVTLMTALSVRAAEVTDSPDSPPPASTDATLLSSDSLELTTQTGMELINSTSNQAYPFNGAIATVGAQSTEPIVSDSFDLTNTGTATVTPISISASAPSSQFSLSQSTLHPIATDASVSDARSIAPTSSIPQSRSEQTNRVRSSGHSPGLNPSTSVVASARETAPQPVVLDAPAIDHIVAEGDRANQMTSDPIAFDLISLSELTSSSSIDPTGATDFTDSTALLISQTETEPETNPETAPELTQPDAAPEPAATTAPRWRFSVIPYAFVPIDVGGSATVRNYTADFNLGLSNVFNALNFAFAGRFEAWKGRMGLILDTAYFSLEQDSSRSVSIPNCLCNIFPSQIDANVKVHFAQIDLGVGYRFADHPNDAATEFDLGPLVFDAIAGMRVYVLHQSIDLSTNLDTSRSLERDNTIFEPLLSGRFRWNLSPKLATWFRTDIAGFGIQGLALAWSFTGGIDWLVSGNTSLLLAYRFSGIQYTTQIRDQELGLDLTFQGPYIGAVFRF